MAEAGGGPLNAPTGAPMSGGGIAAVFLERRDLVRRLLVAQGSPPDQAEDILQDMWLKIGRARIGPVADPVAYLMRMATNLAADRRVAAHRRSTREAGFDSHLVKPVDVGVLRDVLAGAGA